MTTVDKIEIEKFSKIAKDWWNPNGKFKPLHRLNPIRIQYIKDNIIEHFKIKNIMKPLNKLVVLDIGCGGGLLSEPMCKMGAKVTGIDASKRNIEVAKLHSKKNNLNINYIVGSPDKINLKVKYDIILNLEIVEHVPDVKFFIQSCSRLLKKNGIMFVATLNKTLKSYLFAIIGAEYVLRWLPIGTHDWDNFVKPEKLTKICSNLNFKLNSIDGMVFDLFFDQWKIDKDTSVNYISSFVKN